MHPRLRIECSQKRSPSRGQLLSNQFTLYVTVAPITLIERLVNISDAIDVAARSCIDEIKLHDTCGNRGVYEANPYMTT